MSAIGKCKVYRVTKPKAKNGLVSANSSIVSTWRDLKAGSMLRKGSAHWTWNPKNANPSKVTVTRGVA